MEPRIQYAKTKDGVNIAYYALGSGTPLVLVHGIYSHLQLQWQLPGFQECVERLAENRLFVNYDCRGSGLSERNVSDFSVEPFLEDIDAVVDRLGLDRFALWGQHGGGPVAVAYAARRPKRVSRLILWNPFAPVGYTSRPPEIAAFDAVRDQSWELYAETLARWALGWSEEEGAKALARVFRESTTLENHRATQEARSQWDLAPDLAGLNIPALLLYRTGMRTFDPAVVRELAVQISESRLVLLEGDAAGWYLGDRKVVLDAIEEFLDEGGAPRNSSLPEGMTAILFVDIAGSTALTEELGDAAFRARSRELDVALREAIKEAGGTPIEGKVMGDGVMATFPSARQAIAGAGRCSTLGEESGLSLHLGIHAGDVIREENTVYGGAVNIAARIADTAPPGEILVSDTVRGLARTSVEVGFEDRGEHELQGVAEPQRLFAVRWRDEG